MMRLHHLLVASLLMALVTSAGAQTDGGAPGDDRPRDEPRGPGGPGGPMRENVKLVAAHDHDGNGWLDREERAEARRALAERRDAEGPRERGPGGGRGSRVRTSEPPVPGPRVSPDDVEHFPEAPLYDPGTLRTIFLTFENDDWEAELQDFHGTDVEVPATMIVDGRTYPGVGVRFRGASSYMMVPAGYKRSLNVTIDLIDEEQRLGGYATLNLANGAGDASLMSTVLYSRMADERLAVPKANWVKVVINGEYWGVYVNVQQFDKLFVRENYGSSKGTRWKVPGSPRGDGGLAYDGEDLEPYRARYEMKSNDGAKAWRALVELCRVLDETPSDRLVAELSPILDIDETLWFPAFDIALVNSDGYWTRASDYSLFRDGAGRFHVIPHDMNEAFRGSIRRGPGGPGGPRGAGGPDGAGPPPGDRGPRGGGGRGPGGPETGGVTLDPLAGLDHERRPLRSRLLAVPELRARYLEHVREIAEFALDWERLGPEVARHRALIDAALREDTRKLDPYEAFLRATTTESVAGENGPEGSLQEFARKRRAFLLGDQGAGTN